MGLAMVLAIVEFVFPAGATDVPLSQSRATIMVYPLALLVTGGWVVCVSTPSADLERFFPARVMIARRSAWYMSASLLLVVAAAGPLVGRFDTPLAGIIVGRTVFLGIALATLSGVVLQPRSAWVPPLLSAIALWLYGTVDDHATPAWWAIPLYPEDSIPATAFVLAFWVLVGVAYSVRDGRAVQD